MIGGCSPTRGQWRPLLLAAREVLRLVSETCGKVPTGPEARRPLPLQALWDDLANSIASIHISSALKAASRC